jgi:hypothetical protein
MLVSVLAGVGQGRTIHALATFTYFFGLGLLCSLSLCLLWTLLGTAVGAFHGLVLGALFGALREGLTGPEIERRILPNQGIWQSMGNIRVFALGGGLTVGLLWGLLNLVPDVLMFWRAPQAEDWWYIVLNNVLFLGFLSGLVPGAACIQHFILRFVLWGNGVMPWRYVRFLDFATERMFLQRVGGHYRFFHDLLRDCFAAMEPKQGRVAAKTRKNLTQG